MGSGHTRLRVRGWGSSNSDDWRKSLALCLLYACSLHISPYIPSHKKCSSFSICELLCTQRRYQLSPSAFVGLTGLHAVPQLCPLSSSYMLHIDHRVGRGLSFFSSRRNWDSQPLTRGRVCPPIPPFLGGGAHSLAREGLEESQCRRGTYTVVLFINMYFVI